MGITVPFVFQNLPPTPFTPAAYLDANFAALAAAANAQTQSVISFGADPTGVQLSDAAVQAAVNTGAPVFFPAGTYQINGPIICKSPNQTFFGPGVIKTPAIWIAGTVPASSGTVRPQLFWLTSTASNCVFSGLRFDGSATSSITGAPTGQPGFIGSQASNTTVTGCSFSSLPITVTPPSGQFIIFAGNGNLVNGCVFNNGANGLLGSSTFGGGAVYSQANNTVVTGSYFYGANDTICTLNFSGATRPFGLVVTGNFFDGGTYGASAALGAVTVQGGAYGLVFTGNYVRGISNSVFIQGPIVTAAQTGIVVTSNIFDMINTAHIAYSDSVTPFAVYGVEISANQFLNLGPATTTFISTASYGAKIHDNFFAVSAGNSGIDFPGGHSIADVNIYHNRFYLYDQVGPTVTFGVLLSASTVLGRTNIFENLFDTQGYAADVCVSVGAGGSVSTLRDNVVQIVEAGMVSPVLYKGTQWSDTITAALALPHTLSTDFPSSLLATVDPGTGKWAIGDHWRSSTPTAAATPGGYCVTAGTPGTWKDEAALAA